MRDNELEFLGVKWSALGEESPNAILAKKCEKIKEKLGEADERRRKIRRRFQKEYEEAKVLIQKRLKILEGPQMAELFKYQLRTWMLDVKETKGKFPDIPKAEWGGSRFEICPTSLPEEVYQKGREATDPEYAKKMKKERKKEKERKKKEKAKEKQRNKKKKKVTEVHIPRLEQMEHLDELVDGNKEYNMVWRSRDETKNPDQKHEDSFIIKQKRAIVAEEVRLQVRQFHLGLDIAFCDLKTTTCLDSRVSTMHNN